MKSMAEIFLSYSERDAAGRHVNGTDRESNHHYGAAYELLWPTLTDRDEVRLVLEVGVASGAGMAAWREIFPNAVIVGFDIHLCDLELSRLDRMEFHYGDLHDRGALLRAVAGRQFDFIVDDATHHLDDNLRTLFWLWPCLKSPGGVYVIEEMSNASSWREHVKLFQGAELVDTIGPGGGCEPLVVIRNIPRL